MNLQDHSYQIQRCSLEPDKKCCISICFTNKYFANIVGFFSWEYRQVYRSFKRKMYMSQKFLFECIESLQFSFSIITHNYRIVNFVLLVIQEKLECYELTRQCSHLSLYTVFTIDLKAMYPICTYNPLCTSTNLQCTEQYKRNFNYLHSEDISRNITRNE